MVRPADLHPGSRIRPEKFDRHAARSPRRQAEMQHVKCRWPMPQMILVGVARFHHEDLAAGQRQLPSRSPAA